MATPTPKPTPSPAGDAPEASHSEDGHPEDGHPEDDHREDGHPEDDVKRRFREALERKNSRNHASAAAGETGDSKVHSAHGPQSHQKSFRRKSG